MENFSVWKGSLAIPISAILVLAIIPMIAIADSDTLNVTTTVGNIAPYISQMTLDSASYDPTENSTTTVTATIRVYDGNGVSDLNDSACSCEVDDAGTFSAPVTKYTNSSCTVTQDVDAYTREYECAWDMDFYDSGITYSTKMYGGDQAGSVNNDTSTNAPTYNYTELIASYLDTTSIAWSNPALSTANVSSSAPTIIYNSGNVQLDANITGANLTASGKPDLAVEWFSVGTINDASDEIQLTTSVQVITNADVPQGSDGTPNPAEILYWFFDTPSSIQPDTYTGQWILGEFESP
jgi:hypothetical protein